MFDLCVPAWPYICMVLETWVCLQWPEIMLGSAYIKFSWGHITNYLRTFRGYPDGKYIGLVRQHLDPTASVPSLSGGKSPMSKWAIILPIWYPAGSWHVLCFFNRKTFPYDKSILFCRRRYCIHVARSMIYNHNICADVSGWVIPAWFIEFVTGECTSVGGKCAWASHLSSMFLRLCLCFCVFLHMARSHYVEHWSHVTRLIPIAKYV